MKTEAENWRTVWLALLACVCLKAALMVFLILYAGIGLGPDEAQYWTWSQQLAFGYYSKPPGIAWIIWLGTQLFSNTEIGVRIGSVFLGSLLPLAVFAVARASRLSPWISFWAAMIMMWSPLGVMATFLAITDVGMVLFWTLACLEVVKALDRQEAASFYRLGLVIAAGALFKWTIYEFWIFVAVLLLLFPEWRSRKFFSGIALSLIGLLPSILWNITHDWATFRHVGATIWSGETRDLGTTELAKGNFADFLGAQAALFSPILFGLFLVSGWFLWKQRTQVNRALLFCGCLSFGLLAAYTCTALFKKMQGNWVDFAYPTAAVVTAWFAWDLIPRRRLWLIGGLGVSILLTGFAFTIPWLQFGVKINLPFKFSPFRHNVGWSKLSSALRKAGYQPEQEFLFTDKYQTTSVLSFYGDRQQRAYFFNLQGMRKNQFSYWPGMAEEKKGKNGYFVLVENVPLDDPKWTFWKKEYKEKLSDYFKEVTEVGLYPLFDVNDLPVKGVLILKAIGYNGQEPHPKVSY